MTVKDAARRLGVGRVRVAQLIAEGRIAATPEPVRGHVVRLIVDEADVERYDRERRVHWTRRQERAVS